MNFYVNTNNRSLSWEGHTIPCAIGKSGTCDQGDGREGDGKTPLGHYALRYGLYRKDRMGKLRSALPLHPIRRDDGWCDASGDPAYNRPVRLPYPASAEKLWRTSHVYDVVIILGHNDSPPVPNLGSAIFLHIARRGFTPTLGCVAISKPNMRSLLNLMTTDSTITIR